MTTLLERLPFLKDAENRKSFFRRITEVFPASDPRYMLIERAYNVAKGAFRGYVRDDGGRYFEHLRAVALILIDYLRIRDHELIVAAILHDIVEDIPDWTVDRVRKEFGDRVAYLVEYLTKPSEREYPKKEDRDRVYHQRFDAAPREFFLIKCSDRLHNTITLGTCAKEKRHRKIVETWRYYMPFAEMHLILLHELEEALALAEAIK